MFFLVFSIFKYCSDSAVSIGKCANSVLSEKKMQNYSRVHRNDYTANPASSSGASFSAD